MVFVCGLGRGQGELMGVSCPCPPIGKDIASLASVSLHIITKKSQDYVKIVGFYRPSHSRPILTPGIQICSQKWSQVNISIGYSYISQVKILYKVKFSKLEICQSDCRFKILAKNCVKKVSFFFQNFDQNIVKINIIYQNQAKFRQKSNFTLFWMFNANFDYVPIKISKKERYFLLIVFSKDFESAIRLTLYNILT